MVQGGVPCAEEKQQPMYGTISNSEFQESHIFEAKKITPSVWGQDARCAIGEESPWPQFLGPPSVT